MRAIGSAAERLRETEEREAAYWDAQAQRITEVQLRAETTELASLDRCCLERLGDLKEKRILDVGCGSGLWSVFLARRGAHVWAIDISPQSIEATGRRAALQGVGERVHPSVMSATALEFPDQFFDAVYGKDILHHVDAVPLGREVARVLKPEGPAVFSENCANNYLLMLARNNLCGRWGISKWSSDDEYPLTREKQARFAQFFGSTEVIYPEFLFFHYFDAKFFGYRNRLASAMCRWSDSAIYRFLPFLRQYSYRQVICCRHPIAR